MGRVLCIAMVLAACGAPSSSKPSESLQSDPGLKPGSGEDANPSKLEKEQISMKVEWDDATHAFRFTNTSPASVWFAGYTDDGPIYSVETSESGSADSKWSDASPGWCGVGIDPHELKPGSTFDMDPSYLFDVDRSEKYMRVLVEVSPRSDLADRLKITSPAHIVAKGIQK